MFKRLSLIICIVSILAVAAGILLGEPVVLLRKGAMVCLSCIGIG